MKRHASFRGFTLLELLAVITILALVVGVAAPQIFKYIQRGRIEAAKVQISGFEQSLNGFSLDCGFLPTTEQGLTALIEAPASGRQCKNYDSEGYLKKKTLPKDPWGNDYVYASPAQKSGKSYDLSSMGPDGQDGTDDDIKSWE